MAKSKVAVLKTTPEGVVDDYRKLMHLVDYEEFISKDQDTLIKLNLSWTKYFPACSSAPWQLEGVLRTLLEDGFSRAKLFPVENKTVVTDPIKGAGNNNWMPVLKAFGLPFIPLPEVEWVKYDFKSELLILDKIFPGGIEIPKMFVGKNVIHLPTVKCIHPAVEITLEDGSLTRVEDLVKDRLRRSIVHFTEEGDVVASGKENVFSTGEDGSLSTNIAYMFWKTPLNGGKIWRIKTRTGREVKTSSTHPFLTPTGWKRAEDIKVHDRIAVPRRIRVTESSQPLPKINSLNHRWIDIDKIVFRDGSRYSAQVQKAIVKQYLKGDTTTQIARDFGTHWGSIVNILRRYGTDIRWAKNWMTVPERTSPDFWRWVGYFIAEGYAFDANGTCRFSWSNTNDPVREDYLQLSRKLFEANPKCHGNELYFDSNHLGEFFQKLGFQIPSSAENKNTPKLLFRCPDEEIASFIQGYLDGDGTVAKDGLHVTTKSVELAKNLQYLLLRLGVVSFNRQVMRIATNSSMEEKQPYREISVYGDDLVRLSEWISLRSENKRAKLKALVQNRLHSKKPSNWDTIPINPEVFRRVREGLGFTQASSGKPSSVNSIENGHQLPTRHTLSYFLDLFQKKDVGDNFLDEIQYMRFLLSDDIAWDHVVAVEEIDSDVDYLYDLSVGDTGNFVGNLIVLHNTHGHSITTGAVKNAFGGLLRETRHYGHKLIHETLVDLMIMQKELHPGIFAVVDGTVCGDGAGPRTMDPKIKNYILASGDSVAIDAVAAKMMGFDPMEIPYIRMCHDMGLGVGDPKEIEVVGEDISDVNFGFQTKRSLVIKVDQIIRKGFLRPFERILLRSPLMIWAPIASTVYHDCLWYPIKGKRIIKGFMKTEWGKLFRSYSERAVE